MTFAVHTLWRAERDFDRIVAWLCDRSPQGADAWLRAWEKTKETLHDSADKFGLAPENEGPELEVREITFRTRKGKDYRVLYTIRDRNVYIMHLRGPGQDLLSPDEVRFH